MEASLVLASAQVLGSAMDLAVILLGQTALHFSRVLVVGDLGVEEILNPLPRQQKLLMERL